LIAARIPVQVHPSVSCLSTDVATALTQLVPITLEDCPALDACDGGSVVISLSGEDAALRYLAASSLRYFHARTSSHETRSTQSGTVVDFSNSTRLDRLFRGKSVVHWKLPPVHPLELTDADEVLATIGGRAIWWVRPGPRHICHVVEFPVPRLAENELPLDYLNGYHFMQLMPLLHFLREVVGATARWSAPPRRACITFDDPNLHAPSYGFFSFAEIAKHARRHNYHVAVATVPLDTWYSNKQTVALLGESEQVLSLLVHGNDHTRSEFAQPLPSSQRLAVVADCLRRIERLERLTRLSVDRALVPPHEALSVAMACTALQMGIEGLSLTLASLRKWNPSIKWPSTLGILPAEMLANGCPIVGRYPLNRGLRGPALMSAYLGRPIVLVGHHADLADGLDILEHAATEIGSVEGVRWSGFETILRSNYLQKHEGTVLKLMPFSANLRIEVAEGVRHIEIAAPPGIDVEHSRWQVSYDHNARSSRIIGPGNYFEVGSEKSINLVAASFGTSSPCTFANRSRVPLRALARRLACEFRDRVAPIRTRYFT
jgi:hypothetical protein